MERQEQSEYEIQHFGFSADQFTEQFRNLVHIKTNLIVRELANILIEKMESSSFAIEQKTNILESITSVSNDIIATMEPTLKTIDKLHRKHFSITPQTLLADDYEKSKFADENEAIYVNTLHELETAYKQNCIMIENFNAELKMYDRIQELGELEYNSIRQVENALQKTDETILLANEQDIIDQILSKIDYE